MMDNVVNIAADIAKNLSHQQQEVLNILGLKNCPLTAHDILNELKQVNPKANRMTIHRCLLSLSQLHIIHKIDCNNTYKICSKFNNKVCHIFICQGCNKQIEIDSPKLDKVIKEEASAINFSLSNNIQFLGLCQKCHSQANMN